MVSLIARYLFIIVKIHVAVATFRSFRSKLTRIKGWYPLPTTFNFYISKHPPQPEEISTISYADSCNILTSGTGIDDIRSKVNAYILDVSRFFTARTQNIPLLNSQAFSPTGRRNTDYTSTFQSIMFKSLQRTT